MKNPGTAIIPRAFAATTKDGSACGVTSSRPPASATEATSETVVTVPAPTSIRAPKSRASSAMLSSGRGELSGTSTIAIPAASSAPAIAPASSGATPRRIAISGQRDSQARNPVTANRSVRRSATGPAPPPPR